MVTSVKKRGEKLSRLTFPLQPKLGLLLLRVLLLFVGRALCRARGDRTSGCFGAGAAFEIRPDRDDLLAAAGWSLLRQMKF